MYWASVPDHTEIEIIASFGSAFQVHMDESTCDPLVITLCLTMQNIHIYILHILMVSSKVSFSNVIVIAMAGRSQELRKGSILKSFSGDGAICA